jgi:regulator of sirC expression with transglutaminase-like and TPR domain
MLGSARANPMAMTTSLDLTLFGHLVDRADADIDLAEAALYVAAPEYPGLDVARYVDHLDRLGRIALVRRGDDRLPDGGAGRVLRFLYEELGFKGNAESYYDPRNSYLNEVLDRRTGIPITLAIVLVEVAARAGVPVEGVPFPGHFLARAPGTHGPTLIDPFTGRVLGRADVAELHRRVTGKPGEPDPRHLEPCGKRAILARLLGNLRSIHAQKGDDERLRRVLERLVLVQPTKEALAELARLGGDRPLRGGSTAAN